MKKPIMKKPRLRNIVFCVLVLVVIIIGIVVPIVTPKHHLESFYFGAGCTAAITAMFSAMFSYRAIIETRNISIKTLKQTENITEATLVKDLNTEFINNPGLSRIESKLEEYFSEYKKYKKNSLLYESPEEIPFYINTEIGSEDRQHLVNYLVHLEGIAALVNQGVLKLECINDLIAYRFFLACNNPHVQRLEIAPYYSYYSGCIKLYKKWENQLLEKGTEIPMGENGGLMSDLAKKIDRDEAGSKSGAADKHTQSPAMLPTKLEEYIKTVYSNEDFRNNPTAYFFNLAVIRGNIERLKKNLPPQTKLYYAMKANGNPQVIDCICSEQFISGIEIASAGELKMAQKHCPNDQILFTGPGKTEYELTKAIQCGIRFINVESMAEIERINRIAEKLGKEKVDILLRVNLDLRKMSGAENMTGYSTKMGIDEKDYIDTYIKARKLDRICVKGIHAFAASGVLDCEDLIKTDKYIFDFVEKLQKKVGNIQVIDFGGGLGIDYTPECRQFDLELYGRKLKQLLEEYKFKNKEIILELGTYIVGNAGYYTAEIVDIKEIKGKKHIILAGGVNHMGLPLEMRRKHPVKVIPMNRPPVYHGQPSVCGDVVDISGPLCIVSDKLSWDEPICKAEIGDIVVYSQAGAYCYEEGLLKFLAHEEPHIEVIDI